MVRQKLRADRVRQREDDGSLVVELVVLVPVFVLFALVIVGCGRLVQARQQAVEAARAGAEAAAIMSTPSSARWAAAANAAIGPDGSSRSCTHASVRTDTSDFTPGGEVTVTVSCVVDLSDVLMPGFPGSVTVTAVQSAPIDPYTVAA
jgi:Flp pilus assembly protein TadG